MQEQFLPTNFPALTTAFVAFLYVAVLYLPFNRGDRDEARIIRNRSITLWLLSLLCLLYRNQHLNPPLHHSLTRSITDILFTIGLTSLLYSGHLITRLTCPSPFCILTYSFSNPKTRWFAFRDYITAPLTEEVVFRHFLVSLWLAHPSDPHRLLYALFLPSILFGLSHFHHILHYRTLLPILFQTTYTFLFGIYAAYLYILSNQNILAPLTAHILCNLLELPDLQAIALHPHSKSITFIYFVTLMGFVGFVYYSVQWVKV